MITANPYGTCHVTRPGYGEPEPLQPVSTRDSQENVNLCLDCPVEGDCDAKSRQCPLNGDGISKRQRLYERDCRVRDLIRAGWRNNEAICEELGISKSTLIAAKHRLRERGEIN